jgi:hypothetical protein
VDKIRKKLKSAIIRKIYNFSSKKHNSIAAQKFVVAERILFT